jgi:two-component system, chemotaxis family, chemotaxis protein CheY
MEDNGLDILKQILNIDKKAKVIMVSAVNQELAIENSIKIGAKAYITKPFNESEIISTIEKVLQQN